MDTMMSPRVVASFIIGWFLTGIPLLVNARATETLFTKDCKCVPNQWEGTLSSLDREFDLRGGKSGASENNLHIHYDYTNKLFAMIDLVSGHKAIADYEKGYKYVIRQEGCQGIETDEEMRKMCLPDDAELLGQFHLGTDIPVDIWQFNGPFNVTMKTTVIKKDCIPISEEIYMSKGPYASVTSSVYLNVKLGIRDRSVFMPPDDCMLEPSFLPPRGQQKRNNHKQAESPAETVRLLKALRSRLFLLQ